MISEISSRTASKTTITVGRIRMASGTLERVRVGLRQALHLAHHVVAEIAEEARRHRRQVVREGQGALGDQRAQALEGRTLVAARRRLARSAALRSIAATPVLAAPDEIGIEADHREAPAHGAAFDGFEQEGGALAAVPQLQEGRDGRQEIADQGRAQDPGCARRVGGAKASKSGDRDSHALQVAAAGRLAQRLLVDGDAEILAAPARYTAR